MPAYASPGEALASRLLADTGVSALVSTRVLPLQPTDLQAGLPYVVYQKTSGGGGMRLNGPTGVQAYGMLVTAYAQTEQQAEAIRTAILAAVKGWVDRPNGVLGCFPQDDASEEVEDDARKAASQTLSLWFVG